MKTKTFFLFIFVSFIITHISCDDKPFKEGRNYYLDTENGNDANNGLSAKKAWKSIDKLKEIQLKAGDSLLLRRESVFTGILEVNAQGKADARIVIDAYGTGKRPCITAPDSSLFTVCITNSDYITLQNIEIINTGKERLASRTGVKVLCEDYGTSHNIILNALNIHDVNGSYIKNAGGGSGILIVNKWDHIVSVFDSLTIEDCVIRRCERNAMIWSAPWSRNNWHLSTNTVVRKNLIEEVPGDGIVPIGCEGALVEYNLMRNCPATLPEGQAAAGFWPWSCDNTILQFNEVSDHKAPWDAQGFDSDYNCTNTTIQYNYSHNNEGGFILICTPGNNNPIQNIGNIGTVVQYNISIDDAVRTRSTRVGIFSPTIHIGGACKNTRINNNILHIGVKPGTNIDRKIITSDSWNGFADSTIIKENIFYTPESSEFNLTESTNNTFEGNYYLGSFKGMPTDKSGKSESTVYQLLLEKGQTGFEALAHLFHKVEIGDGTAVITVVNKKAIEELFVKMSNQ
jgi:hypothetical protein